MQQLKVKRIMKRDNTGIFIVVRSFRPRKSCVYSSWCKTSPPRSSTNNNNAEYKCDYKSFL